MTSVCVVRLPGVRSHEMTRVTDGSVGVYHRDGCTVAGSCAATREFLRRLSGPLDRLPRPLGSVIGRVLNYDASRTTPTSLARDCGMTRRSLERHLACAGLAPPLRLISAARLVYAFDDWIDPSLSFTQVAKRNGWSRLDGFRRHALAMTGWTLAEVRSGIGRETFLERLSERVCSAHVP